MLDELDRETVEEILAEPEPTLNRDETTIIYLDQNKWGNLLDGRNNPDSPHADTYHMLQQSVDNEAAICPFSFARFLETNAHEDPAFKRQLYELMVDLSNNYSLRNYFDTLDAEIIQYLTRQSDLLPTIDAAPQIFGRGLVHPHGQYDIDAGGVLTDEDKKKLDKVIRSEYVTRLAIQSDEFLTQKEQEREQELADYVNTIESARQEAHDLADTDEERWQILIAQSFVNDVLPTLTRTALQLGIDPQTLIANEFNPHQFDTPNTQSPSYNGASINPQLGRALLEKLIAQFPSYYCRLNLTHGRDFHWDRKIEANDLKDIMSLAVAIPYTDIVITERFFANVAYKHDLHTHFDTNILTDLHNLEDDLPNTN